MKFLIDFLRAFVESIVPPDTTVDDFTDVKSEAGRDRVIRVLAATRAWRWNVAGTLVLLVAATLYMYLTFARAADVDNKIESAVQPIQTDVATIKQQLKEQAALAKERQIQELRQRLFETRIAQCKARADDKPNPYSQRMSELQSLFFNLTNSYWPEPDCEDL